MNKYKVSDGTAKFIDCLTAADELRDKVYEALKTLYGEEQAGRLMAMDGGGVHESFKEVRQTIVRLLSDAVYEHAGREDFTEI